jgi:beta-lactamase class A
MAFALDVEVPAHVERPALVVPAPREASFGRVGGTVGRGTARVRVLVDGDEIGAVPVRGRRFSLRVGLPPRDVRLTVVAEDALGNSAETRVAPVFGLPQRAHGRGGPPHEDAELARKLDALVDEFDGISAVYVQDLRTGAGAAWNATARFPAASTVKLAIAIEVLRTLEGRPARTSDIDRLLELMLVHSDNEAANELLAWLGGTAEGGAGAVNGMLAALGLGDSQLYGGFLTGGSGPPIPLEAESQPSFVGKYTTAWDLAQLHRALHLAAAERGPMLERLAGSFTPADARFLLWILAHSADRGKLDRYIRSEAIVPHKAGWVSDARHDAGLVYWKGGAFVAAVMTYTGADAGEPSDELAGRVAEVALEHFRAAAEAGEDAGA